MTLSCRVRCAYPAYNVQQYQQIALFTVGPCVAPPGEILA
jgi:hypothetical protein